MLSTRQISMFWAARRMRQQTGTNMWAMADTALVPPEGHTHGESHTVTMMMCQAFEAPDLRLPLTSMLIIKRWLLWENSLAMQLRGEWEEKERRGQAEWEKQKPAAVTGLKEGWEIEQGPKRETRGFCYIETSNEVQCNSWRRCQIKMYFHVQSIHLQILDWESFPLEIWRTCLHNSMFGHLTYCFRLIFFTKVSPSSAQTKISIHS